MMFYQKIGSGDSLLLLHSGGMTGDEWTPQIKYLQSNFQLLIPDLLGHGKSLVDGENLSIKMMANAVLDLLRKEKIDKVNICGSSMGGAVALYLAINYPEKIKTAVIYRISYRKNKGTHEQTKIMANPEYWRKFGLHKYLSKIHSPQGDENSWQKVIARVSDLLDPNHSDHCHDLEDLKKIDCPVLLIVGDCDPVAPLSEVMQMYQTISNASLWVIPSANHVTASNTWRALSFAEEVKRFIQKNC